MPRIVDHEERRREIADAILAVIARDGIAAVTQKTVAAEAGWSTGILGHYLGNRHEMLLAALRRAVEIIAGRLNLDAATADDARQRLAAILAEALPLDDERVALTRIFLFFYADSLANEEARIEIASYMGEYRRHIKRALRQAQTENAIDPDLDPQLTADALAAMVDGYSQHAVLDPEVMRRLNDESPIPQLLEHLAPPHQDHNPNPELVGAQPSAEHERSL